MIATLKDAMALTAIAAFILGVWALSLGVI